MDSLSDYEYELPADLIAQEPLADRAGSRLLVLNRATGNVTHRLFRDFPTLLHRGDVLVVNETRVTALRLSGTRLGTGGRVELLVLRPVDGETFLCLIKPAKRLTPGVQIGCGDGLIGTVIGSGEHGERLIQFNDILGMQTLGRAPLPPYITRELNSSERYQTVYSRLGADGGSAAAPTAGLHFTPEVLEAIKARGVRVVPVTLEVGIDTFRPVQVENVADHVMHGEVCSVSPEAADAISNAAGRVVCVGTTTARTLETFARLQGKCGRTLLPGTTTSKLFLRPGCEFRVVDALLTNFHLPRTTLLMMLSAFSGRENVMHAYAEAIQLQYRFLSFGDAMFIV